VLWLQRVKELKVQCEGLREEASIAASNSASGSVEFSQGEFASRVLASLSNLIAFTQVLAILNIFRRARVGENIPKCISSLGLDVCGNPGNVPQPAALANGSEFRDL
jgi:hypothetical protein